MCSVLPRRATYVISYHPPFSAIACQWILLSPPSDKAIRPTPPLLRDALMRKGDAEEDAAREHIHMYLRTARSVRPSQRGTENERRADGC